MNKKVLLAEDEPATRLLIERIVTKSGFEVDAVENRSQVTGCLDTTVYCLLITDLMLTDITGVEIITLAREGVIEENRNIPVVVLSGKSIDVMKQECDTLGIEHYIEKPFSPSDIRLILERLL